MHPIEESNFSFDLSYLKSLSGGDKEFEQEMLEIFFEEVPYELGQIKENIQTATWDKVVFFTHKIKSKIRIVGLHNIYEIAEHVEHQIRNGAPTESFLPDLQLLINTMEQALIRARDINV